MLKSRGIFNKSNVGWSLFVNLGNYSYGGIKAMLIALWIGWELRGGHHYVYDTDDLSLEWLTAQDIENAERHGIVLENVRNGEYSQCMDYMEVIENQDVLVYQNFMLSTGVCKSKGIIWMKGMAYRYEFEMHISGLYYFSMGGRLIRKGKLSKHQYPCGVVLVTAQDLQNNACSVYVGGTRCLAFELVGGKPCEKASVQKEIAIV